MSAPRSVLDRVLASEPAAWAVLHRPESGVPGTVDVLEGEVTLPATLGDIPLPAPGAGPPGGARAGARHDVLAVIPYRQLAERGFAAPDDGAPLVAMAVTGQQRVALPELLGRVPRVPARLTGGHFDVPDDRYAETVRRIVADEIGTGEGSNFVIKRSFLADIGDYSPVMALSFFRNLLEREQGAYWTFVIHLGRRTFVGATPERHLSLSGGTAVMNPISGTYRYPPGGPTLRGVTEFLADRKETDELYMVVDEELKMMARICEGGGRVTGPHLKEMARLAHTEYFIEGRSERDVREILRETMFAPTVTGSPLESAARVIARHEPRGRGYYSGVAALIGRDPAGGSVLDSAILIRTADIDADAGRLRVGAGATLVRHSDPRAETEETRAKVAGLLGALEAGDAGRFATHPDVLAALRRRNTGIADFWLRDNASPRAGARPRADKRPAGQRLAGRKVLVIDAEDDFTAMLAHQLDSLALAATVRRFDQPGGFDGYDLVVLGPGPGDPRSEDHPRIGRLRSAVAQLLAERRPFVAVCLSHQVLCLRLGLHLARREVPNQGVQRQIDLFGSPEKVGFYNTFAARGPEDKLDIDGTGLVELSRDPGSREVHALRGPHFASMQFHAESILTVDGPRIWAETIQGVLGR